MKCEIHMKQLPNWLRSSREKVRRVAGVRLGNKNNY